MTDLKTRILSRCIEDGDCLVWTGGCSSRQRPVIWDGGRVIPVRTFLWTERHGAPKPGYRVTCSCGTPRCVGHLTVKARNEEKLGKKHTLAQRARQAAVRRETARLSIDVATRVRSDDAKPAELARELGVDVSHIYRIRAGLAWQSYGGPWAGLGART